MKWITYNFPLKLVSVLLALGFWMYVAVEVDSDVNRTLSRTVAVRGLAAGLTVSGEANPQVEVSFNTKGRVARRLKAEDVVVWADARLLRHPGEWARLPVMAQAPFSRIVRVAPDTVLVKVDRLARRELAVQLVFKGRLSRVYELGGAALSPSQVTVTGPATLVNRIQSVRLTADKSRLEQTPHMPLSPRLVGLSPQQAGRVVLVPATVWLSSQLIPRQALREAPVSVITQGQPPAGWRLAGLKSTPQMVRLSGPALSLKGLSFVNTRPVDLGGRREDFTMAAALDLPPGVSVLPGPVVSVSVSLEPLYPSRELEVPVPHTFGPTRPATVRVRAWGPAEALERLGVADFEIKLSPSESGQAAVAVSAAGGAPVVHAVVKPGHVKLLEN